MSEAREARDVIGRAVADTMPRPHPDHESELATAERFENAGYITDRLLMALAAAGFSVERLEQVGWMRTDAPGDYSFTFLSMGVSKERLDEFRLPTEPVFRVRASQKETP